MEFKGNPNTSAVDGRRWDSQCQPMVMLRNQDFILLHEARDMDVRK